MTRRHYLADDCRADVYFADVAIIFAAFDALRFRRFLLLMHTLSFFFFFFFHAFDTPVRRRLPLMPLSDFSLSRLIDVFSFFCCLLRYVFIFLMSLPLRYRFFSPHVIGV